MFRNRQPAWPYRCTGKDARTGVFFFALRAGAARAFPAAGHARGREAAASPAANTAARRRPARGANRARQTRACASWDGAGGGIAGREHGGAAEGRRAAQTVRAQPARAPRGMARAAASPAANTAARRKPVRGANRARPTRACAPRDGTGGGIAGREHGGAAKAGARRRSCAPNPRVHPRGMARAAASPAANTAARRRPARGANRARKPFRTAQNDRALQLLPF